MKKKLILFILAMAGLSLVLFLKNKHATAESAGAMAFDTTTRSKVKGFFVKHSTDSTKAEIKNGIWVISADDFPLDTAKVNKFLTSILKLENSDVVSRNPEKAAEYGMGSEEAREIRFFDAAGKTILELTLGKTAQTDYNSTYWKLMDKDEVYRTPGSLTWEVPGASTEWKDKKLFRFTKDDIQSLEVSWRDTLNQINNFAVESKGGDEWSVLKPGIGKGDPEKLNAMADRFKEMEIDAFPKEGDKPDSGRSPDMEIHVRLRDGKTVDIIGQEKDYHYFIKHPKRTEIVKLASWRFENFKKSVDEIFLPDSTEVDSATNSPNS